MRKKYFKHIAAKRDQAISEAKNELTPLLDKPYSKFKVVANRYPRRALVVMFVIASVNFLLFLYLNRKSTSAYDIKDIYSGKIVRDNIPEKTNETNVPFTIGNYFKMKEIKDSLEYYLSIQHKTRADTILLLRLFRKYEAMDTSFKTEKMLQNESH